MTRLPTLALAALLMACSSESESNDLVSGVDAVAADIMADSHWTGDLAGSDATSSPDDNRAHDQGEADAAPQSPCQAPFDDPIPLSPDGPSTQIHVAAAFDGDAVWATFSAPDENGGFDIWATRTGCTGETLVAPFLLHETPAYSEMDSAIAVSADRVLVAWQQDNKQQPDNLSTFYQLLNRSGEPLLPAPVELPTLAPDTAPTSNSWMPAVAATPTGFAIASATAVAGATGFQVLMTQVDLEGTHAQTADVPYFEADASQVYPTLAWGPTGAVVAWTRTVMAGDDRAEIAWQLEGGAFAPAIDLLPGEVTGGPSLGGQEVTYVAFAALQGNGQDILVRPVGPGSDDASCRLGKTGALNHSPAVSAIHGLPVAVWHENQGGLKNKLYLQHCQNDGESGLLAAAAAQKVNDAFAAPYPPALTPVGETVVFIAWSEGTNPDYRAMGRFVQITP